MSRFFHRNYYVFAGLLLVAIAVAAASSSPIGKDLVQHFSNYDGLLGGIVGAAGTIFAGYLAFVSGRAQTTAQVREATRNRELTRANELLQYASVRKSLIDIALIKLNIFDEYRGNLHVNLVSFENIQETLKGSVNLALLHSSIVMNYSSQLDAKLGGAFLMLTEIGRYEQLRRDEARRGMPTFEYFLAFDIPQARLRLAEAEALAHWLLLYVNTVVAEYNDLSLPLTFDESAFIEIADRWGVDRSILFQQLGLSRGVAAS